MSPVVLPIILLIVLCVVGIEYCFRGNRNLKIFIAIYGFWLGYSTVMHFFAESGENMLMWALIAGAVIAALSFFLFKAAVFIAGGLFGLAVYFAVTVASPALLPGSPVLMGILFFAGFGVVTLLLKTPIVIIATAFYGAYSFTESIGILIGVMIAGNVPAGTLLANITQDLQYMSIYNSMPAFTPWVVTIVLAVAGMIKQFRATKRRS